MNGDKLKILLMGDYSNCHRTLATGLRRLGHDVTVASNGTGWMNTERDLNLRRRLPGKLGGLSLWLDVRYRLKSQFSGFDIVAINNPGMVDLRPERCRTIFDMLKCQNRSIFLTAMGTDSVYARECISTLSPLSYNEWRMFGRPTPLSLEQEPELQRWIHDPLESYNNYIYENIDGATTVLYEYDLAVRRRLGDSMTEYIGIPIDTTAIKPVEISDRPDKVRIFLGRHRTRQREKGTDIFEHAAREVVSRHCKTAELVIVENRPYNEYIELLRSAHLVLDQLYSYSPATNAMLAMAMGINVVSGGENLFYDFIGESENRPIINVSPDDYHGIVHAIEEIVRHPETIAGRGRRSRDFVVKHNDVDIVARRALNFWTSHLARK